MNHRAPGPCSSFIIAFFFSFCQITFVLLVYYQESTHQIAGKHMVDTLLHWQESTHQIAGKHTITWWTHCYTGVAK